MKRFILPILLIALLLLVGCDQDMRNGFANFLGTFSGNAYLDSGMIPPDHSNAAATVAHITNLGGTGKSGSVSGGTIDGTLFGLDDDKLNLGLSDDITFLIPQEPEEQQELKNNLEDALGSDSEKEALLTELSQPAEGAAIDAAEGTVALLDALLDEIFDSDGENDDLDFLKSLFPTIEEGTDLTQGDVLMLQLMTDLVGNAVELIGEVKEGGGDVAPKDVIPLVDEVIFVAWVAGQVGGTTSLDFSGFGGLSDFVTKMMSEGEGEH